MGSYDISRINFDPAKHYASVRMQQGRVLTDDDWNENERIDAEDKRSTQVDIIGAFGSPDDGFKIAPLAGGGIAGPDGIDFTIKAGTMYLGGLRLLLHADETYRLQHDWLQLAADAGAVPEGLEAERYDLVYLEAWQQPVSAVEDGSLFEVALGGPDTTTRIRNMRRVRLATNIGDCDCREAWQLLIEKWEKESRGNLNADFERTTDALLKVGYTNDGLPEDLCTPTAAGGYLGAENQAIRVQLVDGGHFTWGFNNASPYYRVTVAADGRTVKMITDPKDQYSWPLVNQVVEILPWSAVLPNGEKVADLSGLLSKVSASYNPDTGELQLATTLPAGFGTAWKGRDDKDDLDNQEPNEYYYMRVWQRGGDTESAPAMSFTPGTPVALGNTGIRITITGSQFIANDYWVIAARPETPDQVVPWDLETSGIAPHGLRRFYAPLAILKWPVTREDRGGSVMHDCRKKFRPLTESECCCTYSVGDGRRSHGDFNNLQEAIDNLPASGGKICLLAGEHFANAVINERRQIHISGCNEQTIVRPLPDNETQPIISIAHAQKIKITNITLVSFEGTAIAVMDAQTAKPFTEKLTISQNNIVAAIHGISIVTQENKRGDNHIDISYNQIGMLDKPDGKPAILSVADSVRIERNRIVVVPAEIEPDDRDPRDPDDPNDPFDPCARKRLSRVRGLSFTYQVFLVLRYVALYKAFGLFKKGYQAMGGIQIGSGSERVIIVENEIIGGQGNGITLGHLQTQFINSNDGFLKSQIRYNDVSIDTGFLYEIVIDGNSIFQMGMSGISALLTPQSGEQLIHVRDLTVHNNLIRFCCLQLPPERPDKLLKNMAFGGVVLTDGELIRITNNRIEQNGIRGFEAICGVFILHGEKTIVCHNTIVDNGREVLDAEAPVKKGHRGGIVLRMAFKASMLKELFGGTQPSEDGMAAATVHDNIVDQPLGHALLLMAFGPVSIVNNQFTTHGVDRTNAMSRLAAAVMVMNLGISKDIFTAGLLAQINANPQAWAKLLQNPQYQQIFRALQYLPNGKTMFADNQTTLDMRATTTTLALSSQLLVSLDDIGFHGNQSELAGYLSFEANAFSFDLVFLNTFLFGITVRSNDNRFNDGSAIAFYSLFSYGSMNTATGNQATHCIRAFGSKRIETNNLVLIDDRCKDG